MQSNEKSVAETRATSSVDNGHGAIESLSHTKQTYTMKLDLRLIPILGCTYTLLFLDRTNSKFPLLSPNIPTFTPLIIHSASRECSDRRNGEEPAHARNWL